MPEQESGYRFLTEHTADAAFIAYGKTLEDVFANAAKAMFDIMTDITKVDKKVVREIEVRDPELPGLMKKWLEELLFIFDAEGLVFSDFNVEIRKENGEYVLKAKAYGEPFDPEKHPSETEVKAVSYHWMHFWEEGGLKYARVLVDI